jgi:hypothetical protein
MPAQNIIRQIWTLKIKDNGAAQQYNKLKQCSLQLLPGSFYLKTTPIYPLNAFLLLMGENFTFQYVIPQLEYLIFVY